MEDSTGLGATRRQKAPKGTVAVQVFKGRLRLCWSHARKRYYLYVGLPDSKINRMVAEQKARQIELDTATGNFDKTLKKYKSDAQNRRSQVTVVDLFQRFAAERGKHLYSRSLEKYKATANYLTEYFKGKLAGDVSDTDAAAFTAWLGTRISQRTTRERLFLIKACWEWATTQGILYPPNPWIEVLKRFKVSPQQMPKPFTLEEMGAIITGFRGDRYYSCYADYVEFLFCTGCRTSEAIGLKWKHVSDNCSTVWIGESLSRGVRKSTKTNRARTITLTPRLRLMLLARRPVPVDTETLVFTSLKGKSIDDRTFRNGAWKTVLARLGINYRKPYTTRSTFISHALDLGMNPVTVAQLTGHDVRVLYENYAGNVNSRPRLPDLFHE